jgi:hypothetical protein
MRELYNDSYCKDITYRELSEALKKDFECN